MFRMHTNLVYVIIVCVWDAEYLAGERKSKHCNKDENKRWVENNKHVIK